MTAFAARVTQSLPAALDPRPMTASTTLNVYSITKTVVAATTVALASRGRLGLDTPIGTLAAFRDVASGLAKPAESKRR